MQFLRRAAALVALIAAEGLAVVAVHRLGHRAPFDLPFGRPRRLARGRTRGRPRRRPPIGGAGLRVAGCSWSRSPTRAARVTRGSRRAPRLRVAHAVGDSPHRRPGAGGIDRGRRGDHALRRAGGRPHRRSSAPHRSPGERHRRRARRPEPRLASHGHRGTTATAYRLSQPHAPQPPAATTLPDEPDPPLVAPFSVVAEPGDNLWDLSATTLARVTGRERRRARRRRDRRATGTSCATRTAPRFAPAT